MDTDLSLATLTPDATLSQIRDADLKAAEMLESIGLETAKYEKQSLRAACQEQKWSENEVLKWIKKHRLSERGYGGSDEELELPGTKYTVFDGAVLIRSTYQEPILSLLKEIHRSFPRVLHIHGNQYPWLKDFQWHFETFVEALSMYYNFQNKKFFPLIGRLQNKKKDILDGTVRQLERCQVIVEQDQERLSELMKTLRIKGRDFISPAGACSTYRIQNQNFKTLFDRLNKQFELEGQKLLPALSKTLKKIQ